MKGKLARCDLGRQERPAELDASSIPEGECPLSAFRLARISRFFNNYAEAG